MDTDLTPIKDALADLTDAELHGLIAASNGAPPIVYGLLVWVEGACNLGAQSARQPRLRAVAAGSRDRPIGGRRKHRRSLHATTAHRGCSPSYGPRLMEWRYRPAVVVEA